MNAKLINNPETLPEMIQVGLWHLKSFIFSFLGIHSSKAWIISLSAVLLGGFVPYFEEYIFFDFALFCMFNAAIIVDIISAITLARIRGGGFETNKAMKAFVKFIGYNYLLYLSHVIHRFFTDTGAASKLYQALKAIFGESAADAVETLVREYHFSPYMVFLYAFLVISLSAIKNFQLSDAFASLPRVDRWLYRNIDTHKNRPDDRLWNSLSVEQQRAIRDRLQDRYEDSDET